VSLTEDALLGSISDSLTRSPDAGCDFHEKRVRSPSAARRSWRCGALLVSALLACACSDQTSHHQPASGVSQECTGDFDAFAPGMTKLAEPGQVMVELSDADPSPPVVRRDNIWWLKLTDAEGSPLTGAQVVASPYMPKHQHGSAEVLVEEQAEGQYQLSPIELIMPGVWEVPVTITAAGEESEALFRFCIAER